MSDAATETDPEIAVRNYLTFLSDPSQLIDPTRVKELQRKVDTAQDPVDKLKAIAAVEQARATDPEVFRTDFVANARQWAEREGVPASAFRTMGVPADVLVAAGLDGGVRRRGRSRGPAAGGTRTRRPSIKADQVERGILGLSGEFTMKDVVDQVGGSQLTVRNALERLEAQSRIAAAGGRSGGRGRAARTWKVT